MSTMDRSAIAKKGKLIKLFDISNDPAGNITYSMCQEDVYSYLRVAIINSNELDGVFLCTDGLSAPFQSYENFTKSFLKSTVKKVIISKSLALVDDTIDDLASIYGNGDDVSLSFVLKKKTKLRYYK